MAYKKKVQGRYYPYLYNVSAPVGSYKTLKPVSAQDKADWARMENNRIESEIREQQWLEEKFKDDRFLDAMEGRNSDISYQTGMPELQEIDTLQRPFPNQSPQYKTSYGANRRDDVMLVQYLLKRVYQHSPNAKTPLNQGGGAAILKIDGIYGPKTQRAITSFQMELKKEGKNIATDGCVDPERGNSAIASISKTAYTISWLNKYFWVLCPHLAPDIRVDPECPMELKMAVG